MLVWAEHLLNSDWPAPNNGQIPLIGVGVVEHGYPVQHSGTIDIQEEWHAPSKQYSWPLGQIGGIGQVLVSLVHMIGQIRGHVLPCTSTLLTVIV